VRLCGDQCRPVRCGSWPGPVGVEEDLDSRSNELLDLGGGEGVHHAEQDHVLGLAHDQPVEVAGCPERIFFIATPIAGLALARRCRGQRRFARYCALTAVATPVLLIATFASGGLLGLTERIVIAVVLAWLTTLALRLRRGGFVTR
jgi:hypothetical protein